MLDTSMLEEMYGATMDIWLEIHEEGTPLVCDACQAGSLEVLHSIEGMDGELLVCSHCYGQLLYGIAGRES